MMTCVKMVNGESYSVPERVTSPQGPPPPRVVTPLDRAIVFSYVRLAGRTWQ